MSHLWWKYMRFNKPGYPLDGGPFTRWRYRYQKTLYKKRIVAGPEPIRHRSVWPNWNYESELFSFNARLNENINEEYLKQALIDTSFIEIQKKELKQLEIPAGYSETKSNQELVDEGRLICEYYSKAILQFWYPKLPNEGIDAVCEYLLEEGKLADVTNRLGITDLIKTEEFPVNNQTKKNSLFAIVSAISRSSGVVRAHLFINDFILTQLIGKDINEIWKLNNPMGKLLDELKRQNVDTTKLVPRLLWSTGSASPIGVFSVGLYLNETLFSKGNGETIDIAEEMAARDGLRRIYGTTEDTQILPFGDKARKYSETINSLFESLQKSKIIQTQKK